MYHGRLYGQSGFCGLFHTEIGGAEEFLRHFRGTPGVQKKLQGHPTGILEAQKFPGASLKIPRTALGAYI